MRDSFIMYRSFFEAINELPKENKAEVFEAICNFALNFKEPELTGISKTIFILIRPQLEANNKRFENGKQPKNKQKGSKNKAKDKQVKSKIKANNNDNNNVNDNKYILFYQSELENNKDKKDIDNYKALVEWLQGDNDINKPFDCWLSLRDQLTFEQYQKIVVKSRDKGQKLSNMFLSGYNKPEYLKGCKSIYLVLNTWLNRK